jgi:hypothetical protein
MEADIFSIATTSLDLFKVQLNLTQINPYFKN